jgi:hypothetical protein
MLLSVSLVPLYSYTYRAPRVWVWGVHTTAYRQVSSALSFVQMSVESFGRLGAPALTLLGNLADQAVQAGGPGLSRAAFISKALRELSVNPLPGQRVPASGACRWPDLDARSRPALG